MRKTVLVTGASRGLGKSIAIEFAKSGYDVCINYNNSKNEALFLKDEIMNNYNVNAYVYKCDVSKEDEVIKLFEDIKKDIGNIDCLVNNAGIAMDNGLNEKSAEEFMKVIEVNLLGTFLTSKYVISVMSSGSIINISSTNGIDTNYIYSIDYDASKAGVISLTHNFAHEYAPNIRVNAVAPGWINTDMNKELDEEFKRAEEEKILLERFAEPEEIASIVYFLASDNAKYVNDTIIRVDGGKK